MNDSIHDHEKQQIETLELSLQHLNETYQKVKVQLNSKDKENQTLTIKVEGL
jgi:hypothetical protein